MPSPGDQTDATLVRTGQPGERQEPGSFVLSVVEGPDAGRSWTLDGSEYSRALLGQSESCLLRVGDPHVSRRHAAFEVLADGLRLTDLGSTNGTYVDRVRVHDAVLTGEEHVRVGTTVLRVERADASGATPPDRRAFGAMVGASIAMRRLYPLLDRLAASEVPVVIEGETGTGKEVLAEALHEMGSRAGGPFVVFDCTAVPPNLVEAELFGHERGAFTGAIAAREGVFEQAHGGTLLIDEIGEFDLTLQPKLLRALERSQVKRVGGRAWIPVDVRVVCATRRDLDREVQAGRFRDDLYHRLAVTRVELPPLRERRGDVRLLAEHFARHFGGDPAALPAHVLARWEDHPWPGNVRELRNAVARQLALGDLAQPLPGGRPAGSPDGDTLESFAAGGLPFIQARDALVERFEAVYVRRMLELHGDDVGRAAEASGIGRRYFQKLRAKTK